VICIRIDASLVESHSDKQCLALLPPAKDASAPLDSNGRPVRRPTARDQRLNAAAVARFHGAKGFVPVVGKDACGVVEPSAAARSFASLDFSLMSYRFTAAEAVAALRG
jgi:hypothetical protein